MPTLILIGWRSGKLKLLATVTFYDMFCVYEEETILDDGNNHCLCFVACHPYGFCRESTAGLDLEARAMCQGALFRWDEHLMWVCVPLMGLPDWLRMLSLLVNVELTLVWVTEASAKQSQKAIGEERLLTCFRYIFNPTLNHNSSFFFLFLFSPTLFCYFDIFKIVLFYLGLGNYSFSLVFVILL